MARHKDSRWNLPANLTDVNHVTWALLMDVRDELKAANLELQKMNSILNCPNFIDIPNILRGIKRNTANLPKAPRKRK